MLSGMETYIHSHTCIKVKRLFLKTLKCGRKSSHVSSGRALKCLSWADGVPCLSLLMDEKMMEVCACPGAGPLGSHQGICPAFLTQSQQGMELPRVKLGEARPGDPKAGVLLC